MPPPGVGPRTSSLPGSRLSTELALRAAPREKEDIIPVSISHTETVVAQKNIPNDLDSRSIERSCSSTIQIEPRPLDFLAPTKIKFDSISDFEASYAGKHTLQLEARYRGWLSCSIICHC